LFQLFATDVIGTGGNFTTGVVDTGGYANSINYTRYTGGKFATCIVDTDGAL
jgi:hypothetical protein